MWPSAPGTFCRESPHVCIAWPIDNSIGPKNPQIRRLLGTFCGSHCVGVLASFVRDAAMSSKRARIAPPTAAGPAVVTTTDSDADADAGGDCSARQSVSGASVRGLAGLPSAIFSCVLQCGGTCDVGAVAAVSRHCRRSAIAHLRQTKAITLDVCDGAYRHGSPQADALRGCSIRGIRLSAAYLMAVVSIDKRNIGPNANRTHKRTHDVFHGSDAAHIRRAVAAIVTGNAATLQRIDVTDMYGNGAENIVDALHSHWQTCQDIMDALAGCRNLTSLEILDDEDGGWLESRIHAIVSVNSGALHTVNVGSMGVATLPIVLRLPLRQLSVTFNEHADLSSLAECTTLEKLSLGEWFMNMTGLPSTFDVVAVALPKLTVLRELHIRGYGGDGRPKSLQWCLPPSLTRLSFEGARNDSMPDMSGASVTALKLDLCDLPLVRRMLVTFGSTVRELKLLSVEHGLTQTGFSEKLPSLLSACPALSSMTIGGDNMTAVTTVGLLAIVGIWPTLVTLDVQLDSSFHTRHLAATLRAAKGRLRDLRIAYSSSSEYEILHPRADGNKDDDGGDDDCRADDGEGAIVLPHLVSMSVAMCDDGLLRRMQCPNLAKLVLRGPRVDLRDAVPPPDSFPALETLDMRVSAPITDAGPSGPVHARLHSLELSWDDNYDPYRSVPLDSNLEYKFRPQALLAILDRCPAVTSLALNDYTPPAPVLAALADPSRRLRPSCLLRLTIGNEILESDSAIGAVADSDALLASALALRACHPRLQEVRVPMPATLDPRIREALFDF